MYFNFQAEAFSIGLTWQDLQPLQPDDNKEAKEVPSVQYANSGKQKKHLKRGRGRITVKNRCEKTGQE